MFYARGRRGDIIITDWGAKRRLGEAKHVVLKPRHVAEKLVARAKPEEVVEWLQRVKEKGLVERREQPRIVVYYLKPEAMTVPVRERVYNRWRDVVEEKGDVVEKYDVTYRCVERVFPDRVEERCEPVAKELRERIKILRHPHGLVELVEAKDYLHGGMYRYVTARPSRYVEISDTEVLRMLMEWLGELRRHGYDERTIRSALRILLYQRGLPEMAGGEALPPVRTITRELMEFAKRIAEKHGADVRVTPKSYGVYLDRDLYGLSPERVEELLGERLSPAQKRIQQLLYA